jgi:hypothetical protein
MPTLIAPDRTRHAGPRVFLAGSIEQDQAMRWQVPVTQALLAQRPDLVIVNPRRTHWDPTWSQKPGDEPFTGQVNWELDYLTLADHALFVFDPQTRSPISLLELGIMLGRAPDRVIVACPEGFWRHGNVVITAQRWGVPVFDTLDAAVTELLRRLSA